MRIRTRRTRIMRTAIDRPSTLPAFVASGLLAAG
jgi:hypothetical protein